MGCCVSVPDSARRDDGDPHHRNNPPAIRA
jgi:hypothetical protein